MEAWNIRSLWNDKLPTLFISVYNEI
jgi:hypothetical protein